MKKEFKKIGSTQLMILAELYIVENSTIKYMRLALSMKHSHIAEPAAKLARRGMILFSTDNVMKITDLGREFVECYNALPDNRPLTGEEKARKTAADTAHYSLYFQAGY